MNPATSVKENVYLGPRFSSDPVDKAMVDWWDRALPRYVQNDFATPEDPLRALADQGYLQGIENAAQWSNIAKSDIVPYPLQTLLFSDKGRRVKDEALAAMPWLSKVPQTDTVYGFWPRERTTEMLSHVRDELLNALKPEVSGIPADLAVRPESLARMSFPQAVERVGRINQWRAKQAEQARLSALNNPAVQMFKEYPDDPRGLRWVELRVPELGDELPEGYRIREDPGMYSNSPGYAVFKGDKQLTSDPDLERARAFIRNDYYRPQLEQALRYEGDTMGHCVGGYCDDVLSGRSRIFSLRDAKGEPHVTIETAPRRFVFSDVRNAVGPEQADAWLDQDVPLRRMGELAGLGEVQDIIQIKGKQNRAPKEDYLPYVQDFVKSGQWGDVRELHNAGMYKLPDGRFIRREDWETGLQNALRDMNPDMTDADLENEMYRYNPEGAGVHSNDFWAKFGPYFEGYARGGRVSSLAAKPCSCDKSLAVR